MLEIGELAPDFVLKDDNNNEFKLSFNLQKPIIIFFYPKDFTPGCTAEACSFRDEYEVFNENDVQIIGVSSDTISMHQKFKKRYNLPFPLLSDYNNEVRKAYKVPYKFLGLLPGRTTYLIDTNQKIKACFDNQFGAIKHITEMKKALQQL